MGKKTRFDISMHIRANFVELSQNTESLIRTSCEIAKKIFCSIFLEFKTTKV